MIEVLKLKDSHPTLAKVRQIEELCIRLGITFHTGANGQIEIVDEDFEYVCEYKEIEQSLTGYNRTVCFPSTFEAKVVFTTEHLKIN